MVLPPNSFHPLGEAEQAEKTPLSKAIEVETFAGKVHVEWDPTAAVTPIGQLPFFIEFLKLGHRFNPWVEDCPLHYTSNNAPKKIDLLGSLFLSILSGHNRYTHLTALRGDSVNTRLLGMNKVVSDDSAIRALKRMDEASAIGWLQTHLQSCYEPLLTTPWILDVDVTVKPIYGHQEGAKVGYNPHKPGRIPATVGRSDPWPASSPAPHRHPPATTQHLCRRYAPCRKRRHDRCEANRA